MQTATAAPAAPLTHSPSLLSNALRLLRWCADGLDPAVPHERVMIRCSISTHTADTPVVVLRSILREMGGQTSTMPTSRADITQAIVDRWSDLTPAGRVPADEVSTSEQRRELAARIAAVADALATGRCTGPEHAAVSQLAGMVATLQAWTPDDRS